MKAAPRTRGHNIAQDTGPAADAVRELLAALQRDALPNGCWQPDTATELLSQFLDSHGFTLPRPRPPRVRVKDGSLVCPVCEATDRIAEVDRAIRTLELELNGRKITTTSPGGQFEHVRYMCQACDATVSLGNASITYNV